MQSRGQIPGYVCRNADTYPKYLVKLDIEDTYDAISSGNWHGLKEVEQEILKKDWSHQRPRIPSNNLWG